MFKDVAGISKMIDDLIVYTSTMASEGNGPCHKIYVHLKKIEELLNNSHKRPDDVHPNVWQYLKAGRWIEAIKEERQIYGVSLKDAKDKIDRLRQEFGF